MRRAQTVGTDDVAGPQRAVAPVAVAGGDADDPAGVVAQDAGDGDVRCAAVAPAATAASASMRVEDVRRGATSRSTPARSLTGRTVSPSAEVEGDLADRRGAAREHGVEQAPAGELDDAAAGERVGRQGVAGQVAAVDARRRRAPGRPAAGRSRRRRTGRRRRRRRAGGSRARPSVVLLLADGGVPSLWNTTVLRSRRPYLVLAWRGRGGQVSGSDLSVGPERSRLTPARA